MQRDYAKPQVKQAHTQGTPIQHDWFSPELTMVVLFTTLVIVAAAVLGYHYHRDSLLNKAQPVDNKITQTADFEFYKMLPNTSLAEPEAPAELQLKLTTTAKKQVIQSAFLIQAGSFRTQQQAVELVKSLQTLSLQAYWQTTPIPNQGTWYRVYIGPFTTAEVAKNTQLTLDAQLVPESFIIHNKMKGTG